MEYSTYQSREASFAPPSKRSKTGGWPHAQPTPADLAKAGFYYKPSAHSNDNAVCFLCSRNLDGWEAEDDPIQEHLKHAEDCGWAVLMSAGAEEFHDTSTMEDPTSEKMTEARSKTFAIGWPHDSKRGWTCKSDKMVEAGWYFAPTAESEDYVSCVYCKLSLDGWEPKDNPFEEHYSRSPACQFFAFAGNTAPSKRPKAKKGRASKASRTSKASTRLSTQSVMSTQSEALSIPDLDESIDGSANTSIVSIMSTASTATTKGKRKAAGSTKATKPKKTRTTKGRKKKNEDATMMEDTVNTQVIDEPQPKTPEAERSQSQEIVYPRLSENIKGQLQPLPQPPDHPQSDNEATPRLISPTQSLGPPEREGSVIPITAESPVPPPSIHHITTIPLPQLSPTPQKQQPTSPLRNEPLNMIATPTSSPSKQSDIENAPPSTLPKSSRPPPPPMSQAKPQSISQSQPTAPSWIPIDLDMILEHITSNSTAVPKSTSTTLSSAERQMTVQDWIKHLARKAEDELRAEGEKVVGVFEAEGRRAMAVLEALDVVG